MGNYSSTGEPEAGWQKTVVAEVGKLGDDEIAIEARRAWDLSDMQRLPALRAEMRRRGMVAP